MIPRAKTENLSNAPPVKLLKIPNIEPCMFEKNEVKAPESIPGVGTCVATRKTPNINNVKSTRF